MLNKFFAFILLIIFFPLLLIISFILLIFSGRPIFYRHNRCGFKYKKFQIYKFRTMMYNIGPEITYSNDDRINRLGRILRQYKLDELPQLINVLKGDMNLIGPRPEAIEIVKKHSSQFSYLNLVKPGISDIASIIFKNESEILNKNEMNLYENEILPIKSEIIHMMSKKSTNFNSFLLTILSIIAIINHKFSLHIISKFFLPYDKKEFRMKLNYLLSINIF